MKSRIHIGFALVFITVTCSLLAQTSARISQPELEVRNNRIVITYQILGSSTADLFNVWIEVTNDNGNAIKALSLDGDVGQNIRGGGMKQISWDYERDNVPLDAGIGVQVFGELLNPGSRAMQPSATDQSSGSIKSATRREIGKPGAILRSVAVPGWGLSAMTGNPHWLKGVIGYGAIASSLVLNSMAYDNYTQYLGSSDVNDFSGFLEKSVNQQKLSKASAYMAAGIWVADLMWTLLADPGVGEYQSHSSQTRLSVGTFFEPSVKATLVAFRYNF